jgi:hypothetical protein
MSASTARCCRSRQCSRHNDLLNANLIDHGVSVRIVGSEHAGMGDRFFDC